MATLHSVPLPSPACRLLSESSLVSERTPGESEGASPGRHRADAERKTMADESLGGMKHTRVLAPPGGSHCPHHALVRLLPCRCLSLVWLPLYLILPAGSRGNNPFSKSRAARETAAPATGF